MALFFLSSNPTAFVPVCTTAVEKVSKGCVYIAVPSLGFELQMGL